MKKFLSISALAIIVTSATFIALGSANISSSNLPLRPTTNRVFAYNYRNHLRRKKVNPIATEMAKFRFWYNFQHQKTKTYDRHSYAAWRSAHDALFPRDENLHTNKENIVRHDDLLNVALTKEIKKVTNGWNEPIDGIHFELPTDIVQNEDGQYMDKRSNLVFEINMFDTKCNALGFQQCAVNYAKHLRARRSLTATWNVSRKFSLRRIIVGTKNVLVPHFQEIFTVNDFGTERTYFIHTLQNPFTNEVVYIEGWSSVYDAPRAENILRAVSRTIRFK